MVGIYEPNIHYVLYTGAVKGNALLKEYTQLEVERAGGSWLLGHRDRAGKNRGETFLELHYWRFDMFK